MNGTVILLCGKIASGKSYYAQQLRESQKAVLLSSDELMLTLFEGKEGQHHDMLAERTHRYLLQLAAELAYGGCDVILDWGFWTAESRRTVRKLFAQKEIPTQLHYMDISPAVWQQRIRQRNALVEQGKVQAYYVDDGLLEKLNSRFEPPAPEEVDRYIR